MTGILKQLKWETLKKRRKDSRLIMLYKGLKGAASLPTNDLVPPIRRTRNHHSLAFQIPMAGTDIFQVQFLPLDYRTVLKYWDTQRIGTSLKIVKIIILADPKYWTILQKRKNIRNFSDPKNWDGVFKARK